MKRTLRETSNKTRCKTSSKPRTIEPSRLTSVRGGRHLGIGVEQVGPLPPDMQNQHNEALVRIQGSGCA